MKTIKLQDILNNKETRNEMIEEMRTGSIFVYPTDTIYGFGCNALIADSVRKIRAIKKTDHPFSVIAPSKEWILRNLVVENKKSLEVLPGPYTLIFHKKEPFFLHEASPVHTLGVRIPAHPITKVLMEIGIPFVSTSANVSGKHAIKKASEAKFKGVNIIIDGGVLTNEPSTVMDLSGEEEKVVRGELRYRKDKESA